MHPPSSRRSLRAVAALTVALAVSGCEVQTDTDRQFGAARLRAATALTKVDPAMEAAAVESIARTTVVSTSTPRAVSDVALLEPLGEGRDGWAVVVRVQVEDDGGLFGGSSIEERCYAFELDVDAQRVQELPSDEVDCDALE